MRRVAAILAAGHICAFAEQDTTTFATSPTTSSPSLRPTKVDDAERTCEDEFDLFIRKFSKHYASGEEKERRKQIFCDNLAWIKKRNGEGHKYSVGITPFVDLSPEEFRSAYGMPSEYKTANVSAIWGGLEEVEDPGLLRSAAVPDSVDWRSQGAVSVVQNQKRCGACWTFATTGALEGAWKVFGGSLYTLSEQQLLDCADAQYGNMGCKGGNPMNGFAYIHMQGLCTARSYPYVAAQGACHESGCSQVIPPGGVRGFKQVPPGDDAALMQALAQQPVAVAIDGDSLVFQTYTGGIITGVSCGTKLDHGVLLVGYGTEGGQPYWIIKNSWGLEWGESGFGRLARGASGPAGECGILSQSSYPVLDRSKVVPGTWDPNPGTVAAAAFAALFACGAAAFCFTQFCKRRPQRQPLLSTQPVVQASARPVVANPWAAQQAVTPAPAVPAATAPGAPPVVQATQVRTGNSAASRLVQQ